MTVRLEIPAAWWKSHWLSPLSFSIGFLHSTETQCFGAQQTKHTIQLVSISAEGDDLNL